MCMFCSSLLRTSSDTPSELLELRIKTRTHHAEVERYEAKLINAHAMQQGLKAELSELRAKLAVSTDAQQRIKQLVSQNAINSNMVTLLETECKALRSRVSAEVLLRSKAEASVTTLQMQVDELSATVASLQQKAAATEKLVQAQQVATDATPEFFVPPWMQDTATSSQGTASLAHLPFAAEVMRSGSMTSTEMFGQTSLETLQDLRLAESRAREAEQRCAALSRELAEAKSWGTKGNSDGSRIGMDVHSKLIEAAEQKSSDLSRRLLELETENAMLSLAVSKHRQAAAAALAQRQLDQTPVVSHDLSQKQLQSPTQSQKGPSPIPRTPSKSPVRKPPQPIPRTGASPSPGRAKVSVSTDQSSLGYASDPEQPPPRHGSLGLASPSSQLTRPRTRSMHLTPSSAKATDAASGVGRRDGDTSPSPQRVSRSMTEPTSRSRSRSPGIARRMAELEKRAERSGTTSTSPSPVRVTPRKINASLLDKIGKVLQIMCTSHCCCTNVICVVSCESIETTSGCHTPCAVLQIAMRTRVTHACVWCVCVHVV
eukprot:m.274882 g.274882  ORF g.274882 m.274882 type:complete len:544 (+) comp15691_c0_seq6:122-1753(+)